MTSDLRDESGFVGGFEALPFGFLVFVAGSLLLVNAWAVFDAHVAASAAAREAVRAFVESSATDADAMRTGEQAAEEAITGHGRSVERMRLTWSDARLERCQPVTVTISYDLPLVAVPWIGAFGRGVLDVSARHTEIVDPFRTGLPVEGFVPEACNG